MKLPSTECTLWLIVGYFTSFGLALSKSVEVDVAKLMDGSPVSSDFSLTLTLENKTITCDFHSNEQTSIDLESVYLMFAFSTKYIIEAQLDKSGASQLRFYYAPHTLDGNRKGSINFSPKGETVWSGTSQITIPENPGQMKYAVFAKISGSDSSICSSYLSSYHLKNARLSMPDRQVLDLYQSFDEHDNSLLA